MATIVQCDGCTGQIEPPEEGRYELRVVCVPARTDPATRLGAAIGVDPRGGIFDLCWECASRSVEVVLGDGPIRLTPKPSRAGT